MNTFRKCLSLFLALLLFLPAVTSAAEGAGVSFTADIGEIDKYGQIVLAMTPSELKDAGIQPHDLVAVTMNGKTLEIPVYTLSDNFLNGEPCLLLYEKKVQLEMCRGSFVENLGFAKQVLDGDTYKWEWAEGTSRPESVRIDLVKADACTPPEVYSVGILSLLNIDDDALVAYVQVQDYAMTALKHRGVAIARPDVPQYLPGYKIKVTGFDSLNTLLLGLSSGQVDCALVSESVADYICAHNSIVHKNVDYRDDQELDYLSQVMYRAICNDYSIMLADGSEDLLNEVNSILAEMSEDGTVDRLVLEYITNAVDDDSLQRVEFDKFEGADTIRFVVTGDLPPMDYIREDGTPAGFSTAVLAEIGRRLHKNIEVIPTENLSRALELQNGSADAAFWTRAKTSVFEWMLGFAPEDIYANAHVDQLPVQKLQFSNLVTRMGKDENLEGVLVSDIPYGLLTTDAYYTEPVVMIYVDK